MQKTLTVTDISQLFKSFSVDSMSNSIKENGSRKASKYKKKSQPAFWLAANENTVQQHKIQLQLGQLHEKDSLKQYGETYNHTLTDQNTHTIGTHLVLPSKKGVDLKGRVDAMTNNGTTVVEHKYRSRGLLKYVPIHEKVQCHMYMYMTGTKCAHLVETHGQHMHEHTIHFDTPFWDKTLSRIDAHILQEEAKKDM